VHTAVRKFGHDFATFAKYFVQIFWFDGLLCIFMHQSSVAAFANFPSVELGGVMSFSSRNAKGLSFGSLTLYGSLHS
jgi:hypothetical protein